MSTKPHAAAPALETERLRLRGFQTGDFDRFHAIWNDPVVYRFISGKAFSESDNWMRLLRVTGLWPLLGYGFWAIEDKVTSKYIGQCGFGEFRREMAVALEAPEVGWILDPAYHRRGIASEALRVILKWGDAHLAFDKTSCMISEGNDASMRIANKMGFRKFAESTYMGDVVELFHRWRPIQSQ